MKTQYESKDIEVLKGLEPVKRRPRVRFYVNQEDISHAPADTPLPDVIVTGKEPFIVIGAISGG